MSDSVKDMVWGEVMYPGQEGTLFPGVLEVLSEFYARKSDCVLTISNDTIVRGIIRRYDSRSVDVTVIDTGSTVSIPTSTIVYIDKTP